MLKMKINRKSVTTKLQNLEKEMEKEVKAEMRQIAEQILQRSPVLTGAYVESHSVVFPASSGAGRMRSSKNRPKTRDEAKHKGIARDQMYSDIERLDLEQHGSASFRNRAPHAGPVEDKHRVFESVKDINR